MQIDPLKITHIGPYAVRRFISKGGMAWVFEVEDPTFRTGRACKMLMPEAAQGEEFLRFRHEAEILAGIDHPNLVTIFDFGQDEATGCFYYVMTLVDGPTLSDHVVENGPISTTGVEIGWFFEILSALTVLHDRGIVHRDIKPANILIGSDNRARLSDLGIARSESSGLETRTNIALGTFVYMAPEQARGKPVGPAADVFAIGLTLFHALTGESIYDRIDDVDSTSELDVLGYLNSLDRTGASIDCEFNPDLGIPTAVQAVVKNAIKNKVDERYADAREVHAALYDAVYGDGADEFSSSGSPISKLPILIGVGILAVAAAGYSYYEFVHKPGVLEDEVMAIQSEVRPLRLEVPAALQRARDIGSTIDDSLADEMETSIGAAQTLWAYAQEDIESKQWPSATNNLRRSKESFNTACQVLDRANLTERAEKDVEALNQRMRNLKVTYDEFTATGESDSSLEESWNGLVAKADAVNVAAAGGACAPVLHALDQIDGVNSSQDLIAGVESGLRQFGPRIAQRSRDTAIAARERANSESVSDSAFRSEIDRGTQLLADGDRKLTNDAFAARDRFDEAASAFDSAAASIPAISARDRLSEIQNEIPAGGAGLEEERQLITEASRHFASRNWREAEEAYRKATDQIGKHLGSARVQKTASARRTEAREQRDLAVADGVEAVSPSDFASASRAMTAGDRAFESEDYEQAAESFGSASQIFRDARNQSVDLVRSVRETKLDLVARLEKFVPRGDCTHLESITARGDCEVAISAVARGSKALDNMELNDSTRLYAEATRALQQSVVEEDRFLAMKPQPPVLTARFPKNDRVEILRGSPQRLEVTVTDPNADDQLSYEWRFDGVVDQNVRGRTFEFTPKRAGRVSVEVTDQTGNSVEAAWSLSIKNLPPKLAVSPRGTINLSRGGTQRFTASAEDPDGTAVSTQFLLDGQTVARGGEYTFNKSAPGNYRLEVVSKDADGATARATVQIIVTNKGPELTVTPRGDVEIDAGRGQLFEARASDPEGTAVTITYKVDGRSVASGSQYSFSKTKAGTYRVEIIATDADGAATSVSRNVVIRPGNVVPTAASGWEREVYDTLFAYEKALESKDIRALERVWLLDDRSREFWQRRFRGYKSVSIRFEMDGKPSHDPSGPTATVGFTQFETLELVNKEGRRRVTNMTRRVTAKLLKRSAGWVIVEYERTNL